MKKTIIYFICLIAFIGCSKSKNDATSATIVGKWHPDKQIVIDYKNGIAVDTLVTIGGPSEYVQYNSDLTGNEYYTTYSSDFKYSISNSSLIVTLPPYTPPIQADVFDYYIKQLASNKLEIILTQAGGNEQETIDIQLSRIK